MPLSRLRITTVIDVGGVLKGGGPVWMEPNLG